MMKNFSIILLISMDKCKQIYFLNKRIRLNHLVLHATQDKVISVLQIVRKSKIRIVPRLNNRIDNVLLFYIYQY